MAKRRVETFENMLGEYVTSDGMIDAIGKTEKESKDNFKKKRKEMRERKQWQ